MPGSERAVIIDTNFVSRKVFNKPKLEGLARRLADRGHATLIPDVVIWEWASHAHEALAESRFAVAQAQEALDQSLGISLSPVPEVEADRLIEAITGVVTSMVGVRIVVSTNDDAVDAIRQQVTQTGMGSRVKGTKTGAADALVLHAVREAVDEYDQVVLASNDRELGALAEDLDRVVVVTDQRSLWRWHGLTAPATDELAVAIQRFVLEDITEALAGARDFKLFDQGEDVDPEIYDYGGFTTEDVRQVDVVLESVDGVEVVAVEVVEGDEVPRLVVAELHVDGVVFLVNWFVGGLDGELLSESTSVDGTVVVPVTVELDAEWHPLGFDVEDAAEILLRQE